MTPTSEPLYAPTVSELRKQPEHNVMSKIFYKFAVETVRAVRRLSQRESVTRRPAVNIYSFCESAEAISRTGFIYAYEFNNI